MPDQEFIERTITSQDGLSLYVRDYPGPKESSRTPLLCLAGLTRNSKDFAGFARFHGRYRRVICPDTRGRGRSDYDPVWQNYHPETYIGDVRHILCALGVHGVVVVGTSMGGIMGMGMAAAMPGALRGLVINDVGPVVRRSTLDAILDYVSHAPRLSSWEDAGRHLRNAFGDQIPISEDAGWTLAAYLSYIERDGYITVDFDPNIAKPLIADKTEVFDIWHLFRACGRIPVLTVRGAKSDILDAELLRKMQAVRPDMATAVVPDVGHAPSLSEPISVEALNDFLEQF